MPSEQGKWGRFKGGLDAAGSAVRDIGTVGRTVNNTARSVWGNLGSTTAGGAFRSGAAETFGFEYRGPKHGQYKGFMGLRGNVGYGNRIAAMGRMASRKGVGTAGKMTLGLAGKALIPALAGFSMYQGFKEGGLLGAAKAGATDAAIWGGMKAAGVALANPAAWVAGGVAAAGYGYYAMGEAAQAHVKRLRHLEMGSAVKDPFGTAATLRSRSIAALNNSSINGRMAIGNEGFLMAESAYSPAFRR